MGTRGLFVVIANDEIKCANYQQEDIYPGCYGSHVLLFAKTRNLAYFKEKVLKCSWITSEEVQEAWFSCGADRETKKFDEKALKMFQRVYPYLHHETGYKVLDCILERSIDLKLKNDIDFAANSIHCEWVYVLDLDENTFETYKGFNQEPLTPQDGFYFLEEKSYVEYRKDQQYHPVKLVKSYSFDNLPTYEQYLAEVTPPKEEDDED